ncbi:MAG: hypothetical protein E7478_04055 [Ruminococcaceae bacterium]|nr:hypothetical protein [Oscillospiraceae bacterium]
MAKKRKNSAPKPKQEGEKVINQLLGSLDDDNDIEGDIAELGTTAAEQIEPEIPEPVKKKRFFFGFAVFMIIMAVIGCISTVRFAVNFTEKLVDNTSLKNEFAQFIFPVVVNDIAPFENTSEIPNTSKITCAMWNILIKKDTTPYADGMGGLIIPEYDVMQSCKEIFGTTITMEHQSVGTGEIRFIYDSEKHVYSANKNIRYLTYAPQIIEMTSSSDDTYKLIVGYLPPALATVTGISGMEVVPEKYMEYTIYRWGGTNTLMSVAFSDYSPETEEAVNAL